jgi:hypothetical protein
MTSACCVIVALFIAGLSSSLASSIYSLLPFQFVHDHVQFVEARGPQLAVLLHPRRLLLEAAQAEPAGPNAADLLRGDEAGLLQDADMLLHAREGHAELRGKIRDGSIRAPEMFEDAAPGNVRERSE